MVDQQNRDNERKVVELFMQRVYGKRPDTTGLNNRHDGKKGHWLETQMGVARNRSTAPDLLGFEMKDGTSSKVSFGDWSASYYIFNDEQYVPKKSGQTTVARRDQYFLAVFGKPNMDKGGRLSWSGEPIPKINQTNSFGMTLLVDQDHNIVIAYSFTQDQRSNKSLIVPANMQRENLVIVRWDAEVMRERVNNKFNQKGWFICKKDSAGVYCQIAFGDPISFEQWLGMVKTGEIFFDSGMYQGNNRPYSQWRANNNTLEKLLVRRYPV